MHPRFVRLMGALGFLAVFADTIRLFARAPDRSGLALLVWGIWASWLVVPLAWAIRLPAASAARSLALGYGTAIFALRVVETCLRR